MFGQISNVDNELITDSSIGLTMYLLLLAIGTLALAAVSGLLLAGAMPSGKTRKPSPPFLRHAHNEAAAQSPATPPLARQRAISAYQAIQAMDLSDDEFSPIPAMLQMQALAGSTSRRAPPPRKAVPATPKIARMRRQQREAAMASR
jgi:hypothetical protein